MSLSVNVSARQLGHDGLVESVAGALTASGLDPWALSLEVTESALVEELDRAAQVLRQVVALGVRIAIDDFGTGWASLTYLRCFPVHELKIDRSFVTGAGHNAHDTAIVRSVVSLGAELGLAVVAEGIENDAQERALLELGCLLGQGYLYGHPVAPADMDMRGFERRSAPGPASRPADLDGTSLHLVRPRPAAQDRTVRTGAKVRARRRRPTPATLSGQPSMQRIEDAIVVAFVRDLLRARSAEGATRLFHEAVRSFGGIVVATSEARHDCLPMDVSLGDQVPRRVETTPFCERAQLERLVPLLLDDTRAVVDRLRNAGLTTPE